MMKKIACFGMCCLSLALSQAYAEVIDFEDRTTYTAVTPTGSYYNGDSGIDTNSNGWNSGSAHFENTYDNTSFPPFEFNNDWSYSNIADTFSPGFGNQYASFAGGGSNGAGGINGGNYAIAFTGSSTDPSGNPLESSYINFASMSQLASVDISNATYTALYARDGNDGFSDPDLIRFRDGDFFRVIISGYDGLAGTGALTGQLTYDLINYGGAGTADDFLLANWLKLDLSAFGLTRSLTFATTSSQIGPFGNDAPAYVAIDNLSITAVPEPASMAMLCVAGAGSYWLRRRRANKG